MNNLASNDNSNTIRTMNMTTGELDNEDLTAMKHVTMLLTEYAWVKDEELSDSAKKLKATMNMTTGELDNEDLTAMKHVTMLLTEYAWVKDEELSDSAKKLKATMLDVWENWQKQQHSVMCGTSIKDCESAIDEWIDKNWNNTTMHISNAIAQLESARAKIYKHQDTLLQSNRQCGAAIQQAVCMIEKGTLQPSREMRADIWNDAFKRYGVKLQMNNIHEVVTIS
jgi:hypothetical protein